MMNDPVERAAVIDVIEKYDFDFPEYMKRFVTELRDAMKEDLKDDITNLPSAQPVITCDGCRFVSTYDTDFPCCSCVRREKDYYEPER